MFVVITLRSSPEERIKIHFDKDSFEEVETEIEAIDFLKFEDTESYEIRLKKAKTKNKTCRCHFNWNG